MNSYIENNIKYQSRHSTPAAVLANLFTVLGNGEGMNLKGYLENYSYEHVTSFAFGEPVPFQWLYPFDDDVQFQTFRKYIGCREAGFKDAVRYFIECVKVSPDSPELIKWKANIEQMNVLLDSPEIEDEYASVDEMDKFLSKIKAGEDTLHNPMDGTVLEPNDSIQKVWFFDVQWSDCPKFVEREVRQLWKDREFGNDNYFAKFDVGSELFERYPNIYFWLVHKGVPLGERVHIHWWW